jgi:hypothetical protein
MDASKILQYSSTFQKTAEYGPDNDPFMNVIRKADAIIQKVLSDNYQYYSKEYFGGKAFSARVVDGNPSTSVVYISTTPTIQSTEGVERATNVWWFENELTDKVRPFGVTIKVR